MAGTRTPNYNLYKPEDGEGTTGAPYTAPFNENLDVIDTRLKADADGVAANAAGVAAGATALVTHKGAPDDHPGYVLETQHGSPSYDAGHHARQHGLESTADHTIADSTTHNASTANHGFLPKLPGIVTRFLDGTGVWRALAAGDIPAPDFPNRTRYVFLSPAAFQNDDASRDQIGTTPDLVDAWTFADGARQGILGNFLVPADWDSGAITITGIWAPGAGTSQTTRWIVNVFELSSGAAVGGDGIETITDVAHAGTTVRYDTFATITPTAAGNLFKLNVERAGAADSNNSTARLLGVRLAYTADM